MGGATILVAELRSLALVLLGRRLDVKNIMMSSASRSGEFVPGDLIFNTAELVQSP